MKGFKTAGAARTAYAGPRELAESGYCGVHRLAPSCRTPKPSPRPFRRRASSRAPPQHGPPAPGGLANTVRWLAVTGPAQWRAGPGAAGAERAWPAPIGAAACGPRRRQPRRAAAAEIMLVSAGGRVGADRVSAGASATIPVRNMSGSSPPRPAAAARGYRAAAPAARRRWNWRAPARRRLRRRGAALGEPGRRGTGRRLLGASADTRAEWLTVIAVGGGPGGGVLPAGAGRLRADGGTIIKPDHPNIAGFMMSRIPTHWNSHFRRRQRDSDPRHGLSQLRCSTNRGIRLGVKYSNVLNAYGNPEKQDYAGPVLTRGLHQSQPRRLPVLQPASRRHHRRLRGVSTLHGGSQ